MKLEKLSASAIRDWRLSPQLFYYRHILRLQPPEKPMNLVFGGAVHAGIEEYYLSGNDRKKSIEKFKSEMGKGYNELSADEKKYYAYNIKEGVDLLTSYFEADDYFENVWELSLNDGKSELYFSDQWEHPINGEQLGFPVNGYIDRVTSDGDIIEYKTAKKPYKQSDVDQLVQPTIYAHAYLKMTGKLPRRIVYIVLVKGRKKKSSVQVLSTTRDVGDIIAMFEEMKVIAKEVENGNFKQRGSHFVQGDLKRYEDLITV